MLKLYEEHAKKPHPPKIPGITKKTARFLKLKSAWYLLTHDTEKLFLRYVLKHPVRYLPPLVKSFFKKHTFTIDKDFYLYNIKEPVEVLQEHGVFVLGFSYCQKPLNCPSGRFTDTCIHDSSHPVCKQCFICQACETAPPKTRLLFIPTVHYIGEKLLELREIYPAKDITFLITACELTLKMFADWGNMAGLRGIGVRLDGRICNTMKAFELSEKGIKPGRTIVLDDTQKRILFLLEKHPLHKKEETTLPC